MSGTPTPQRDALFQCAHRNAAQDPMGGLWCQDCGAVKPPYANWLGVIFGQEPDRDTQADWSKP